MRILGIRGLQMEDNRVNTIIENNQNNISSAAYAVLTKWYENQPDKTSVCDNLREALQRADMRSLIADIQ